MLFVYLNVFLDYFFPTGNGKTVRREAKDQPERKVRPQKVEDIWPKFVTF